MLVDGEERCGKGRSTAGLHDDAATPWQDQHRRRWHAEERGPVGALLRTIADDRRQRKWGRLRRATPPIAGTVVRAVFTVRVEL